MYAGKREFLPVADVSPGIPGPNADPRCNFDVGSPNLFTGDFEFGSPGYVPTLWVCALFLALFSLSLGEESFKITLERSKPLIDTASGAYRTSDSSQAVVGVRHVRMLWYRCVHYLLWCACACLRSYFQPRSLDGLEGSG